MKQTLKVSMIAFFMLVMGLLFVTEAVSETVVLDTPFEREITINIPDDPQARRDLIVTISELYWGERYDLENALGSIDDLQVEIESLAGVVTELQTQNDELIVLLEEKVNPDPVRAVVDGGLNIHTNEFGGELGLGVVFFDTVTVRASIGFPFTIGVSIGLIR